MDVAREQFAWGSLAIASMSHRKSLREMGDSHQPGSGAQARRSVAAWGYALLVRRYQAGRWGLWSHI
eukprot:363770-Chlamydomonas_euryale.AAC.7